MTCLKFSGLKENFWVLKIIQSSITRMHNSTVLKRLLKNYWKYCNTIGIVSLLILQEEFLEYWYQHWSCSKKNAILILKLILRITNLTINSKIDIADFLLKFKLILPKQFWPIDIEFHIVETLYSYWGWSWYWRNIFELLKLMLILQKL